MPEQPPIPQKPIPTKKWVGVLALSVIGFLVLIMLITSLHFTTTPARQKSSAAPPSNTVTAGEKSNFSRDAANDAETLGKSAADMQAAIDRARGVDLARLLTPLPVCNQAMRDQLHGQYFVDATTDGRPVRLVCDSNDQWAVVPDAATSIMPMTTQQEQAYRSQHEPRGGGSSGKSAAQQKKEAYEKRLEEALNSSSVALDYEAKQASGSQGARTVPVADTTTQSNSKVDTDEQDTDRPKYDWNAAVGPNYHVLERTIIETILTNRLAGEFTGPVDVMVTTNLYSHNHQQLLIPQGTRILGESMKVSANQQRRLAVVFHRMIMPDGYSVDMDKFAGLDRIGASGLTGRVNTHWMKVIGTAILVGAIGGLAQIGAYGGGYGPNVAIETGIGAQTGQQATQILDRAMNVLPTVTVYEGTPCRIWVEKDFDLPAYENHRVNPNL